MDADLAKPLGKRSLVPAQAVNPGGNSLGGGGGGRKSRLGVLWFRRVGQIKIGLPRFIETAVAMSRLAVGGESI